MTKRAELTLTQSFGKVMAAQTRMLASIAAQIDDKGYAVVINARSPAYASTVATIEDNRLFTYLSGALTQLVDEYARFNVHKIRPVLVRVSISPAKVLKFAVNIPRRVGFLPLITTLDMYSKIREGSGYREEWKGQGFLRCTRLSDRCEYHGETRECLDILLKTLDMPIYRECYKPAVKTPKLKRRVA